MTESSDRIIAEFIQRSERQSTSKHMKLQSAISNKDAQEVAECSFQPITLKNPSYQMSSRYLKPVSPKHETASVSPTDTQEPFSNQLRQYTPTDPVETCTGVSLTPEVLARLDLAESFYEVHKDRMGQLRATYKKLLIAERRAVKLELT